ncbi:exosortase/archaeosortase family protein [archaeon]|nr:MAG: exosortase/archaeosortase family protein [archaeon]
MHKRRAKILSTIAWFMVKFNILALPMYIIIISGFSYEPFRVMIASLANLVLNGMGYATTQYGPWIGSSIASIDVSWDSTGWKSMYALVALVLATPVKSSKLNFLAIGLPAVFLLNIARIVTTIGVTLSFGIQYFDILHLLLWREGLITAVVAIWGLWLWREKDNIRKDQGIFRWALDKRDR